MNTATPATPATPRRLLRLPQVLDKVGTKRTPWLDLVRRGDAPKPVKIGRAVSWDETEIDAWIAAKLAAR